MTDEALTPSDVLHSARYIDVYQKRIVVRQGQHWQWAHIAPGFCAVADWTKPNEHIGIMRLEDALSGEDAWRKPVSSIEGNIAVLWGGFVDDATLALITDAVRIGRTQRITGGTIVIDGPGAFDFDSYVPEPHEADRDDRNYPAAGRRT